MMEPEQAVEAAEQSTCVARLTLFHPKTRRALEVTRRAALGSVKLGLTSVTMLYLVGVYASSLEEAEGFYRQFRTTAYVSFTLGFVIEGGLSLMPERDLYLTPWWNAVLRFFMAGIVKNLMLFDLYQIFQPDACYNLPLASYVGNDAAAAALGA